MLCNMGILLPFIIATRSNLPSVDQKPSKEDKAQTEFYFVKITDGGSDKLHLGKVKKYLDSIMPTRTNRVVTIILIKIA